MRQPVGLWLRLFFSSPTRSARRGLSDEWSVRRAAPIRRAPLRHRRLTDVRIFRTKSISVVLSVRKCPAAESAMAAGWTLAGVFLLVVLHLRAGGAFNVDTEYATVVSNPQGDGGDDSYFGFSVALRRALPGTAWNSW